MKPWLHFLCSRGYKKRPRLRLRDLDYYQHGRHLGTATEAASEQDLERALSFVFTNKRKIVSLRASYTKINTVLHFLLDHPLSSHEVECGFCPGFHRNFACSSSLSPILLPAPEREASPPSTPLAQAHQHQESKGDTKDDQQRRKVDQRLRDARHPFGNRKIRARLVKIQFKSISDGPAPGPEMAPMPAWHPLFPNSREQGPAPPWGPTADLFVGA